MTDEAAGVVADAAGALRRIWWLPVVRGVVLLVLGLLMLVQPLATVSALVWVFGAFAVVDGLVSVAQWLANRREPGAGWWVLEGLAGIVFGVIAFVWTGATVTVLFYLVALWALVLGVLAVFGAAVLYRARDVGWHWVLTFGLVAFLFGLLVVTKPPAGIDFVVMLIGLFAFVEGAVLVVSGFATRAVARELGRWSAAG